MTDNKKIDIAHDIVKKMIDKGLLKSVCASSDDKNKNINELNIELVCKALRDIMTALSMNEDLQIIISNKDAQVAAGWLSKEKNNKESPHE
jgi:hypothetical protein